MKAAASAFGGAVADHVIHQQHPALERCANELAAFAVGLGLLAVKGRADRAAPLRQGDCRGHGDRNALVGRAEQHVELEARGNDGVGVEAAEFGQLRTAADVAEIEEVGAAQPGLQFKIAKAQHLLANHRGDEAGLGAGGAHGQAVFCFPMRSSAPCRASLNISENSASLKGAFSAVP